MFKGGFHITTPANAWLAFLITHLAMFKLRRKQATIVLFFQSLHEKRATSKAVNSDTVLIFWIIQVTLNIVII